MLSKKSALHVGGTVFALIALAQLWRAATGAVITLNAAEVPVWVSWVAVIVSGLLSWIMFSSACCCGSSCATKKDNHFDKNS